MSLRLSIDLNADVGEGCGHDDELVPLVSSVNIACGAHAGDEATMRSTVELALRHGAAIGAHPGFADRANFGRREIPVSPREAADRVVGQTHRLEEIAHGLGARLRHVKLHGALYNMASRDPKLADAVARALFEAKGRHGDHWVLVALAGSELAAAGRALGMRVLSEGFADRAYTPGGALAPRSVPGAFIVDEELAAAQAARLARDGLVRATDGSDIRVDADTICIHGDSPRSAALARRIRERLAADGIGVRS
jgi:UPF0271 protein